MILVGLTGGIGSGKSTVAGMFGSRGAVIADADQLARAAIAPGSPGHHIVAERFGQDVLTSDGSIDRDALARVVFADPQARRDLETITHPEVFRLLAELVDEHRESDDVVVFDAALLVETGFADACDVVVVVAAPADLRIRRVVERGMDEEEAKRRIAAQVSDEEREAHADVVITNDGDLDALERRVDELWRDLRERSAAGG
ncbi:MAG TPA: dephospho-CoA kinase [Actinomycetota bacterium]